MTIKQIEQLEKYLKEAIDLHDNPDYHADSNSEKFYGLVENLNNRIASTFANEYKNADMLSRTYEEDIFTGIKKYNNNKIFEYLSVMVDCINGILNAIPNYDTFCTTRKDIVNLQQMIDNNKLAVESFSDIVLEYKDYIKLDDDILRYGKDFVEDSISQSENDIFLAKKLKTLLQKFSKEIIETQSLKEETKKQKTLPNISVDIKNNNNNSLSNNINISISTHIERAKTEIENACLGKKEEKEILAKIDELEIIAKETNKKTKWEKMKENFKWVASQSLQVASWIVPLIYQIMQNA